MDQTGDHVMRPVEPIDFPEGLARAFVDEQPSESPAERADRMARDRYTDVINTTDEMGTDLRALAWLLEGGLMAEEAPKGRLEHVAWFALELTRGRADALTSLGQRHGEIAIGEMPAEIGKASDLGEELQALSHLLRQALEQDAKLAGPVGQDALHLVAQIINDQGKRLIDACRHADLQFSARASARRVIS